MAVNCTKPIGVRARSVNSRSDVDESQPLVNDWNVDVMLATTKSKRERDLAGVGV